MEKNFTFTYRYFQHTRETEPLYHDLLNSASEARELAYAPYSQFHVGAAILLENGMILKGGNQENASYPAGLCAERVALAVSSSLYPSVPVVAIAIASRSMLPLANPEVMLSPCGICRQSILEQSRKQKRDIKIFMTDGLGRIMLVDRITDLLPFGFSGDNF
jgi:cytidine deaminase